MSSPDRDMSRAAWQRGEGMIIFTQLADIAFRDSTDALPDGKLHNLFQQSREDYLCEQDTYGSMPDVMRQSYRVSRKLFTQPASRIFSKMMRLPGHYLDEIAHHTHFGAVSTAFGDAELTMAHYPLNLAFTAAKVAETEGLPRYNASSLADVAKLVRSKDVRDMAHEAAFTANGILATDADHIVPNLNGDYEEAVVIYDAGEQHMRFSDYYMALLHSALRDVNKNGISEGIRVEERTSSGCPVRHNRPHLTHTENESNGIQSLSNHFGVSLDELTAPRERTGIDIGLDYLADTLDRAHLIHQRLATTALVAS